MMLIRIIGTESLGGRGLCCVVEVAGREDFIPAGVGSRLEVRD